MSLRLAGETTNTSSIHHRTLKLRAFWWGTAMLLMGIVAVVLPIRQIHVLGARLNGFIGNYDYAGYYEVSYSGGKYKFSDSNNATVGPFLDSNGAANAEGGGSTPFASCYDQITANFTWVPGYDVQDPPDSVIVQEDSDEHLYNATPSGTYLLADGFGTTSTSSLGLVGTRISSVQSPGSTPAVSATPVASASSHTPGGVGVSLKYTAKLVVPKIVLSGTTSVSGVTNCILIGQQIVASLDTPGFTQSNWSWTINGDPFNGFHTTSEAFNPNITGAVQELVDSDKHQASISYFYRSIGSMPGAAITEFADHNSLTIQCSATATDSKGGTHSVQASTTVLVYQPSHHVDVATGALAINKVPALDNNGNPILDANGNPTYQLDAQGNVEEAFTSGIVGTRGSNWRGKVMTPPQFAGEQGMGSWVYAQIISPTRSFTLVQMSGNSNWVESNTGLTGLDKQFPFDNTFLANGLVGDAEPPQGSGTGDSPGFLVTRNMIHIKPTFDANTYMLYTPPSVGQHGITTSVPLHRIHWQLSGEATKFDTTLGAWTYMDIAPPTNGISLLTNTTTSVLPTWDKKLAAGSFIKLP